jgi:hypothetical protein
MVGKAEVTSIPPIVACTVVAVPAVPATKVAVYVPFRLSVVAPTVPVLVPPLTVKTTARPPVVRSVPLASLAWSVRVTAPPKATVPVETAIVDMLVETVGRSGCWKYEQHSGAATAVTSAPTARNRGESLRVTS